MAIEYSISNLNQYSDLLLMEDCSNNFKYLRFLFEQSAETAQFDEVIRLLPKIQERYMVDIWKKEESETKKKNSKNLLALYYTVGAFLIKNEYWSLVNDFAIKAFAVIRNEMESNKDLDLVFSALENKDINKIDTEGKIIFELQYLAAFDFLLFAKSIANKRYGKVKEVPDFVKYSDTFEYTDYLENRIRNDLDLRKVFELNNGDTLDKVMQLKNSLCANRHDDAETKRKIDELFLKNKNKKPKSLGGKAFTF